MQIDSVRIESNHKVPRTNRLSLGVLDMYDCLSYKLVMGICLFLPSCYGLSAVLAPKTCYGLQAVMASSVMDPSF